MILASQATLHHLFSWSSATVEVTCVGHGCADNGMDFAPGIARSSADANLLPGIYCAVAS